MSENMTFLPKSDVLTLEELYRLCTAFIKKGVRKIRLTGGEPLVRRDLMWLIENLNAHKLNGELDEVTLTTNGSQLVKHADGLYKNGVRRLNISLDTLDRDKFHAITRWGNYDKVMDGIAAAKAAGFAIKINTVALRGVNDDEFDRLLEWCGQEDFDITFIETMPLGDIGGDRADQYLPLTKVRKNLEKNWQLTDNEFRSGGPARYVDVAETGRQVGFITPLTHNFCESCNRVRLTCTGRLYMCLGQDDQSDLRAVLRETDADEALSHAIDEAIFRKPKGHDFVIDRSSDKPSLHRHMSTTGG
jgi:cyclic pyranopterin phosphate synthase